MLLKLQKGIIYGPVNSRRLGWSLGVNLLPSEKKACPFNCVYCQYGWTDYHSLKLKRYEKIPSVQQVKEAVKAALEKLNPRPAYITFSGNGESTIHPDFGLIVDYINEIRDKLAPHVRTAILSNSATVSDPSIRESLSMLDVRILKLDCGNKKLFNRYNQPCPGIDLDSIIEGLSRLPGVILQTLFSKGQRGNFSPDHIANWIARLKKIQPVSVQVYSLDRSAPDDSLQQVSKAELQEVKTMVQREGLTAKVF
jgi:wyosine [tRNA(Phe)-imidazoG37] synthetase (radical SAM superfamily)